MRKPWSKGEIAILRKLYPATKQQELADRLKRPGHAITYMAGKLGLKKAEGSFYWTDKEVKLLKELFSQYRVSIEEIAERLDRGIKAVRTKANQMGLKRPKRPK
jgi:hypothetical protein